MRSFLCRREAGNLLVYSAGQLESDAQAIDELGGIARRYVNHGHEAEFVSELLEGPLYVNERDAAVVAMEGDDEKWPAAPEVEAFRLGIFALVRLGA